MEDNKFIIMDFSGNVLQDENWLKQQPVGTNACFVRGKSDSGSDDFSLAIGEGRNGGNALRVRSTTSSQGLPGFWIINGIKGKVAIGNPADDSGYLAPRGKKFNRLHAWVKFPKGFRQKFSEQIPKGHPFHQNFVVGTYQFAPGSIGDINRVVESNNWHGYQEMCIRHDLAQDEWIHIVSNQIPGDQRGAPQGPVADYCGDSGNYWELSTRLYFDCLNYFSDPEIEYPIDMLVDSIYLTYEEEEHLVEVKINDFKENETVEVVAGQKTTFDLSLKNLTDQKLTGTLIMGISYGFVPKFETVATVPKMSELTLVELGPNETKNLKFSVTPKTAGRSWLGGIMFVPSQEFTKKEGKYLPSKNDVNVGSTKFIPIDAEAPDYHQIKLVTVNELSNKFIPISRGGQYYETGINQTYHGKLEGFSRNNTPLNFIFIPQKNPSKGGKFTLNSDGTFNFVPEENFEGSFFFRYKVSDGISESKNYGSWIIAKRTKKKELTDKEIIDLALNNLKIELDQEIQKSLGISLFSLNRTKRDLEETIVDLADKKLIAFALERFKPFVEKIALDLNANLDLAKIDIVITNL